MAPRSCELPDDIKRRLTEARERAVKFGGSLLAWRDELKHLRTISVDLNLGLPTLEHRIRTYSTSNLTKEAIIHPPIARVIGPGAKNRELRTYELPAIVLTLDGLDEEIRNALETALIEASRRYPTRMQKPGRQSEERQQPWPVVFSSWRDHDILPLAEFVIWRSSLTEQERERYTKTSFARWRRRNEYAEERSTKPAMEALGRAIDSVPMLDRALRPVKDPLDAHAWDLVAVWGRQMEAEEAARQAQAQVHEGKEVAWEAQAQAHDAEWLTLNRLLI